MLLNADVMQSLPGALFGRAEPYPWQAFEGLLAEDTFHLLCGQFPSADRFEVHRGIPRVHGQRPHDRLYLAYEESLYRRQNSEGKGVIRRAQLAPVWRDFLEELSGPRYLDFASSLLGTNDFHVRYAWHLGGRESEVSPHKDSPDKLGTHIFYFNPSDEWQTAWGGDILILGGKRVLRENPDFSDFASAQAAPCVGNVSFLFQNTERSWHGMKGLQCPPGVHRRLFNVIFERPEAPKRRARTRSFGFLARALKWRRAKT